MRHRQIEAFRSVMIAGSITDAGKALRISQPSVSRLIADLEKSVGFALFERRHGRIFPTAEAVGLFEEVERSFQGLDKLRSFARTLSGQRGAQVTIAAMPALCLDLVPTIVQRTLAQHPRAKVTVDARSSDQVVESVAQQRCDVGLATPPFDVPGVAPILEVSAPCMLVTPGGHRLARQLSVKMNDLRGDRLILLTDLAVREALLRQLAQAGMDDAESIDTTLSIVAYRFVERGLGVALVDPFTASAFAHCSSLSTRPLEPAIPFKFGVLAPERRVSSRTVRDLIDGVRRALESMRSDAGIPLMLRFLR